MIPYCLTDKQTEAVGAVLIWKLLKGKGGEKLKRHVAIACIRLQTYY